MDFENEDVKELLGFIEFLYDKSEKGMVDVAPYIWNKLAALGYKDFEGRYD